MMNREKANQIEQEWSKHFVVEWLRGISSKS